MSVETFLEDLAKQQDYSMRQYAEAGDTVLADRMAQKAKIIRRIHGYLTGLEETQGRVEAFLVRLEQSSGQGDTFGKAWIIGELRKALKGTGVSTRIIETSFTGEESEVPPTPAERAARLVGRIKADLGFTAPELQDLKWERFQDELERELTNGPR